MRKLTLLFLPLLIVACSGSQLKYDVAYNRDLASVVKYAKDTNHLYLTDFFPTMGSADSVTSSVVEVTSLGDDWSEFQAVVKENTPWLSVLKIWKNGTATDLLAYKQEVIAATINYNGKAKEVFVTGQMSAWQRNVLPLGTTDGENWSITLKLPAGNYQYLLVVDGKDMLDPSNPDRESNGSGGFNSLLKLQGVDPAKAPIITTDRLVGNNISIITANNPTQAIAFWQNIQIETKIEDGKIIVAIPDNSLERSFIRVWASNENGIANDVLIPLKNGKVVAQADSLDRKDKHRNILYSLMIDRFNNGNVANDKKLNQADVLPIVDYMGGDIKGITEKINAGFFDDLGITTIWISPITQNPYDAWGLNQNPATKFSGYHGYWPIYVTAIDERFGTKEELEELLETAHSHGLNVILDYVANHVHINSPILKEHPDWTTPAKTPDGRDNLELWDEFRLTTWFDKHIPTLDLERAAVYEPMTDSALYWIANFDFDGFRHDATKHIPETYWRTLTAKMKQRFPDRDLYQIGETYGSPELINSYVKSGMLDAQFDFNVYDAATSAIGSSQGSMRSLASALQSSLDTYGYHNLMGYITGNHDRARFISLAGGSLSFDENAKAAGWTRKITVGDSSSYDKLSLLEAFIFTIPGVPTVYQGDDYGIPGGNDPDNRHMMIFNDYNPRQQKVKDNLKKLATLRKGNLALIYGDMVPLYADDNVMVFVRNYMGNVAVVGLNKSDKEQVVDVTIPIGLDLSKVSANFGNALNISNNNIKITLAPLSFEVATN